MAALHSSLDPHQAFEQSNRLLEKARIHSDLAQSFRTEAYRLKTLAEQAGVRHVEVKQLRPKEPRRDLHKEVREVAYELTQAGNLFLTADVSIALGITTQTALRYLREWEAHGMLECTQEGTSFLWGRVVHESEPVNRRKEQAPEMAVVHEFKRQEVAGTGRARTGSPLVDQLIREVAPQGVTIKRRKHKVEFVKDGQVLANASSTPGASSLKKTRGQLRQHGIQA